MLKCGQLDCIFILEMTKIEKKKKKQGLMARHTQRNQRNTFGNMH